MFDEDGVVLLDMMLDPRSDEAHLPVGHRNSSHEPALPVVALAALAANPVQDMSGTPPPSIGIYHAGGDIPFSCF